MSDLEWLTFHQSDRKPKLVAKILATNFGKVVAKILATNFGSVPDCSLWQLTLNN